MDNEKEFQTKEFILEDGLKEKEEELEIIVFGEEKKKKDNIFQKIFKKWKSFNKKIKFLIILALILIIAGSVILILTLTKKDVEKQKEETKTEEDIVIKDNYKYVDGTLIILGASDEELGTYECHNKSITLCFVANELSDDNFDVPKAIFEDNTEVMVLSKVYHDKFVFIYDNVEEEGGVISLYNLQTKEVEETYLGIKSYNITNKDIIILEGTNNKYALGELKEDGLNILLKPEYDYMGIIVDSRNETVVIKNNNKWGILDFKGKEVFKSSDEEIKKYNNKYLITTNKDGYALIDFSSNPILEGRFTYIELLENYILTVLNTNSIRIYDYSGNKMNEEGIRINNTDYNPTYVYLKDGTFKEIKRAYEYQINGEIITINAINFNKESTASTINLLEGRYSINLKYYSYLGGKLYFYKDEKKNELIGSYTCENANFIADDTVSLDKCFVAMNTNEDNNDMVEVLNATGISPIINNRFIFIRDAVALATDSAVKIKLYDLIDKKILSQYVSVNTYSTSGNTTLYHEASNGLFVVAKNKSAKYGLIKINDTSVSPAIAFEYDSLERLGSYYLVKKGSNWLLLDNTGKTLTSEFSESIRGYKDNYLKTISSANYQVYTFDKTLKSKENYKYVELYDNYFAGVGVDNKLNLYNYSNGIAILNIPVQLETTTYYATDKKSFVCTFTGSTVTIIITKSNATTETFLYNLVTGDKL